MDLSATGFNQILHSGDLCSPTRVLVIVKYIQNIFLEIFVVPRGYWSYWSQSNTFKGSFQKLLDVVKYYTHEIFIVSRSHMSTRCSKIHSTDVFGVTGMQSGDLCSPTGVLFVIKHIQRIFPGATGFGQILHSRDL